MSLQESVQRMVEAIERTDIQLFAELFAKHATVHHPLSPEPLHGREAICEGEQTLFSAFSDIQIEIRTLLISDRRAAVEVLLRATNSGPLQLGPGEAVDATNRRIELPAAWFFEYDDEGLVLVERDYFDTAAFLSQLGLQK